MTTGGSSSVAAYLNAGSEQTVNGLPSPLTSSDTATVRGIKTNLADVGYTGVVSGTTARGNLININIIGETTMGATEGTPQYGITGGQTTVQYEAKGTVTTGIEAQVRNLLGIPYRTVSLGSGTFNVNAGASSPTQLSLVTATGDETSGITISSRTINFNGDYINAGQKGTPDFSVTSVGKTELGTSYSGKIYLSTGNTASLQFTEVTQFSDFGATPENAPSSAWAKLNSAFTQSTSPPSSLPKIESFSLSQVADIQPTGGAGSGVTGSASVAQLSTGETVNIGGSGATATTESARVVVPTIPAEGIFQQAAVTAPAETTTGLQTFNAYDPAILTSVGATALTRGTAASTVATTGGGTAVAAIAEPTGTRTINAGVSTTKVGLGVSSQGVVFNSAIGINAPSSSRAVGASASAIGGNVGATKTQTTYRTINEGSFLALNTAGIAFNTEYPRILQGHPTKRKVTTKEQNATVVKTSHYLNIDKSLLYTEGVVTAKPQVKDELKFSELNNYKAVNAYKTSPAYKNIYKNAEVNKTTNKTAEKSIEKTTQVQKQVQNTTAIALTLPDFGFNVNTFNLGGSRRQGKTTRIAKATHKNLNYQYITDITAQTFHIKAPKGSKRFYEGFGAARPIV